MRGGCVQLLELVKWLLSIYNKVIKSMYFAYLSMDVHVATHAGTWTTHQGYLYYNSLGIHLILTYTDTESRLLRRHCKCRGHNQLGLPTGAQQQPYSDRPHQLNSLTQSPRINLCISPVNSTFSWLGQKMVTRHYSVDLASSVIQPHSVILATSTLSS